MDVVNKYLSRNKLFVLSDDTNQKTNHTSTSSNMILNEQSKSPAHNNFMGYTHRLNIKIDLKEDVRRVETPGCHIY